MTNKTATTLNNRSTAGNIISSFFGIVFFAIGLINIFWGNDAGYGIFVVLLAFLFFTPIQGLIKNITGFTIPLVAKIVVGAFILWSAFGVGELFDKIELMQNSFN